jgi:ABC-type polysaccharide/polyol phosphate export permease
VSAVPERFAPFLWLNPFTWLLTLYHDVLYTGALPSAPLLAGAAAVAALFLLAGYAVFTRFQEGFSELV